jgi:hypothetical protein
MIPQRILQQSYYRISPVEKTFVDERRSIPCFLMGSYNYCRAAAKKGKLREREEKKGKGSRCSLRSAGF